MIEVTYEVYRFRKWWKNSFQIIVPHTFYFSLKAEEKEDYLYKEAFRRDLWKIRNLKYKTLKNG